MTGPVSEVREVDLRVISGPVREVDLRVDLRSILDPFWTLSRPILGNLIKYTKKGLHLAVGRPYLRK